jgi:hypothetical protein
MLRLTLRSRLIHPKEVVLRASRAIALSYSDGHIMLTLRP